MTQEKKAHQPIHQPIYEKFLEILLQIIAVLLRFLEALLRGIETLLAKSRAQCDLTAAAPVQPAQMQMQMQPKPAKAKLTKRSQGAKLGKHAIVRQYPALPNIDKLSYVESKGKRKGQLFARPQPQNPDDNNYRIYEKAAAFISTHGLLPSTALMIAWGRSVGLASDSNTRQDFGYFRRGLGFGTPRHSLPSAMGYAAPAGWLDGHIAALKAQIAKASAARPPDEKMIKNIQTDLKAAEALAEQAAIGKVAWARMVQLATDGQLPLPVNFSKYYQEVEQEQRGGAGSSE